MDKDKALQDMTELLLSKAKMLSYHCNICKSPLFEKNDKIICPVCGEFKVERKKNIEKAKASEHPTNSKTIEILEKKRDELLIQIKDENNPEKLISLLEALEKINKLL